MRLTPEETARFYRIWFALLSYVNDRRQLVPTFPSDPEETPIPPATARIVRDALWADDTLREEFIAENPADLPPEDLALVESWRYRLAGAFYIERHLKKYSVFLSQTTPAHAYGVLGLVSPLEDIIGPYVPIYVQAVLLPFEGKIIYDTLIQSYAISFGPGIRAELKQSYREVQEREGITTTLEPPDHDDVEARTHEIRGRNTKLLAAFSKELFKSAMKPRTVEDHVSTIATFADRYLLASEPPRGLIELTPGDVQAYLDGAGKDANRVSFKRFARFLYNTYRIDPVMARELTDLLKYA
ncbi:MAG TPA: hypothetical protein VHB98_18375 [Chloroflexota bacterium]|jgi:hypothetical protein|nr:hypothetical protein [Chloroflexota bacterium]